MYISRQNSKLNVCKQNLFTDFHDFYFQPLKRMQFTILIQPLEICSTIEYFATIGSGKNIQK